MIKNKVSVRVRVSNKGSLITSDTFYPIFCLSPTYVQGNVFVLFVCSSVYSGETFLTGGIY